MKGKTVVVTGANSGIGKATATALAARGATIYMVCRNRRRGENARRDIITATKNTNIHLMLCDLSSMGSIQAFGTSMREQLESIDVLINNAGAVFGSRQLSLDGLELTFALNHVGYFLTAHYLLDLLRKGESKRIVNVASMGHKSVKKVDFENLQNERNYKQLKVYCESKLYNIYFTRILAEKLKKEKITVNCLHPGVVSTNFGSSASWYLSKIMMPLGRTFMITPEKGAETSIYLASSENVKNITGKYFDKQRETIPARLAMDDKNAKRIWDETIKITGIKEFGKVVEEFTFI